MPIILATQEAEMRRIEVQSQPWQIVLWDPISKKPVTKKGWWSSSRCRPWVEAPVPQKKKKEEEEEEEIESLELVEGLETGRKELNHRQSKPVGIRQQGK
jgi:hypothetical protein